MPRDGLSHSQAEAIGLSPLGKKQAMALAKVLGHKKIAYIVTSPMQRAKETAAIIQTHCRVPVVEDAGLGEHMVSRDKIDRGEIRELRQKVREKQDFIPADGESFKQSVSRFRSVLKNRAITHSENVVVVTHREIMQNFLMDEFSLPSAPPIHEASVSAVEYRDGSFRLLSLNDTPFALDIFFHKIKRRLRKLI